MRTRDLWLAAMAVLVLASCERRAETQEEGVNADAPVLDQQARQAAIDLIRQNLMSPVMTIQQRLSEAAADGQIAPHELHVSMADGYRSIGPWAWDRGLLTLTQDQTGAYLTLSDRGYQFVAADTAGWFDVQISGAPRMECQAAGSATSANCEAVVTYAATTKAAAGIGAFTLPPATANLTAAFQPQQGWSVSALSVDGETPAAALTTAMLGSLDQADARQEQFMNTLRQRIDAEAEAAATAANATEATAPAGQAAPQRAPAVERPPAPERAQPMRPLPPGTTRAPVGGARSEARIVRRPTRDELRVVYPREMLARSISGQSGMTCTVSIYGVLSECRSDFETPPGSRFGPAGVQAARLFRASPARQAGQPLESTISVTIDWQP